jgi:hypothetical protein
VRKPVILRVVDGTIPAGQLEEIRVALERDYVPAAMRTPGLERYIVATRPADGGDQLAMLTVWADVDSALRAYGGNLGAVATLDGIGHGEVLEHVDYYEVDDGESRRLPGVPKFLRLSTGSVGRGLDADIQRDLRGRLADLGPETVDAYVGRRVKGPFVEIALASAWLRPPAGRTLDDPLWPDLSEFFETFGIRVLEVLLEGAPPARS